MRIDGQMNPFSISHPSPSHSVLTSSYFAQLVSSNRLPNSFPFPFMYIQFRKTLRSLDIRLCQSRSSGFQDGELLFWTDTSPGGCSDSIGGCRSRGKLLKRIASREGRGSRRGFSILAGCCRRKWIGRGAGLLGRTLEGVCYGG